MKFWTGIVFCILMFSRVSAGANEGRVLLKESFQSPEIAKRWTFSGHRNGERYTSAGISRDGKRAVLMLQDYDWAGDPAIACSPRFEPSEAWELSYDFKFSPPGWGKEKNPYSFRITLLDSSGETVAELGGRYLRTVPGGFLPGDLPVRDETWYRVKAELIHTDRLLDLSVTDLESGRTRKVGNIRLQSDRPPVQIRFEVIPGHDTHGVLKIADLAFVDRGALRTRERGQIEILENERMKLTFHADGFTSVEFRNDDGAWHPLGMIGVPELPGRAELPAEFRGVALEDDNPELPRIDYRMIPTATDVKGASSKVFGVEALNEKGGRLYLLQWTLFPEGARLRIYPSGKVPQEWGKNLCAVPFIPAAGIRETARFSPERFYLHRTGGEPEEKIRGQVIEFGGERGHAAIAVSGESPTWPEFWQDGKLRVAVNLARLPWAPDFYSGTIAFSVRTDQGARRREALARAGDERLLMEVESPDPFWLLKEPGTYRLQAHVGNYFRKRQRIDLHYVVRDFHGNILREDTVSNIVEAEAECSIPISVEITRPGPVFFDIFASHEYAGDYRRVCGGYLPEYRFRAGKMSRIGMTGWRNNPGQVTESRTPEQVLSMMRRIGVSLVRQCYGYEELAHSLGIRTWYHNNIGDWDNVLRHARGENSWLANRESVKKFMAGNLKNTRASGSEVFEFSNEWNLSGGERKAKLAEVYAFYASALREVRDRDFPEIKLTGLSIANGDMPYMRTVYEKGAWDDFDYLAFHAAGITRSPENDDSYWSYLGTLKTIREATREFGDKPLYISELYSASGPNFGVTNNQRTTADDLCIQMALAVAADVKNVMLYMFNDFEPPHLIGTHVKQDRKRECHFGLFHRDWMPKVPLWAYQTAAKFFDPGEFLGDLQFENPDARGLLFDKGPNGKFAVLWSRKDGLREQEAIIPQGFHRAPWVATDVTPPRPLALTAENGKSIRVTDVVGETKLLTADRNGIVILPLTESPVYVEGARLVPVAGEIFRLLSPRAADERETRKKSGESSSK